MHAQLSERYKKSNRLSRTSFDKADKLFDTQSENSYFYRENKIQRKASCACGGGCGSCQTKNANLPISHPSDASEIEADHIANKVMRMSGDQSQPQVLSETIMPVVQTKSEGKSAGAGIGLSGRITSSQGNGVSLDGSTQSFMQNGFGTDFSNVRIHNNRESVQMNRELNAKAFTIGSDIYFNEGQYRPDTAKGQYLIAHELTHTLQQKGTGGIGIQKQDDAIEVELVDTPYPEVLDLHNRGIDLPQTGTAPPVRQQNVTHGSAWSQLGRRTTKRAPGFTGDTSGTYISRIDVQINPNSESTASLRWVNMGNSRGYSLPGSLKTSPGAGNCSMDCSNVAQSQTSGSHCTPLSPPDYTVQGYSPHLGSYPSATFVTWYHYDRGVAFHYYAVPAHPESHGCTRLDHAESGAEWIYDNSLPGITTVTVSRDATQGPGPKCWRGGSLIDRPPPRSGP